MYRASFSENISALKLDISTLKMGKYLVKGDLSPTHWAALCKEAGLRLKGAAAVQLVVEKNTGALIITGEISIQAERECGRTLELFMDQQKIKVEEKMPFYLENEENSLEIEAPETLDVADFLTEQIILGLTPYPVNPATLNENQGSYDVVDGEEEVKNNPFAALMQLKN